MSDINDQSANKYAPTEETLIQARLSHWINEKARIDKELAEAKFNINRYERLLREYNKFKQSIK